jgi:hypothetical protein
MNQRGEAAEMSDIWPKKMVKVYHITPKCFRILKAIEAYETELKKWLAVSDEDVLKLIQAEEKGGG